MHTRLHDNASDAESRQLESAFFLQASAWSNAELHLFLTVAGMSDAVLDEVLRENLNGATAVGFAGQTSDRSLLAAGTHLFSRTPIVSANAFEARALETTTTLLQLLERQARQEQLQRMRQHDRQTLLDLATLSLQFGLKCSWYAIKLVLVLGVLIFFGPEGLGVALLSVVLRLVQFIVRLFLPVVRFFIPRFRFELQVRNQ